MKNVVNRALAAKKKALFFLFSALVLCACEGPMGPQGPQGPKGDGTNWKIADLDVDKWDYTNFSDNNYFFAKYDVPALSSYVFTDGNVQVYLVENNSQRVLPFVRPQYEILSDKTLNFFTRTIDAHFGIGWVQVEVRDSDFEYEVPESQIPDPNPMKFRVVMTW